MPGVGRFSSAGSAAFALRQTHVQKRYSSGALAYSVSDIRFGGWGRAWFVHCECLCADWVLHPMLGWRASPRRLGPQLLPAFPAGQNRLVLSAALVWMLWLLKCPLAGFSLDLDSMMFCREGKQKGHVRVILPGANR